MLLYESLKNKPKGRLADKGIKVPFKWAGSKNRMFKRYTAKSFFPEKAPGIFVDMFAGSGVVSQWMLHNFPGTKIVLNDTSQEMTLMYSIIKGSPALFEKEYMKHVAAYHSTDDLEERRKYYYALRNKYALNHFTSNSIENSAALFYMLQTGFNGIWQTSKNFNNRYASPCGKMDYKKNGELFNLDNLRKYANFLSQCEISNRDFSDTAKYAGKDTIFYADPPYRASFAQYKSHGAFTDKDQERLCTFLNEVNAAGSRCALSNREYYDADWQTETNTITQGWFADKFSDEWNVSYFDVKYTVGKHNKGQRGKEVLIKNY